MAVAVNIYSAEGYSHRQVVGLEVVGQVDELDELEAVVLAPSFVGLRCAHVVQVDALVHLASGKGSRDRVMACDRKPPEQYEGWGWGG